MLIGLISNLLCLFGTVAFQFTLHKKPDDFAVVLQVLAIVLALIGAQRTTLGKYGVAWLWFWFVWMFQEGILFVKKEDTLMKTPSAMRSHKTDILLYATAIGMGWMAFLRPPATSNLFSITTVITFIFLSFFSLSRPKTDRSILLAVILYITFYNLSSVTLRLASYSKSGRSMPTEFANIAQSMWILFMPFDMVPWLTALLCLCQLLISLFVMYLNEEKFVYLSTDFPNEEKQEHHKG